MCNTLYSRPTRSGRNWTRSIAPMSMAISRRATFVPKRAEGDQAMAGPRHISVSEASRPVLPRHANEFDETRQGG